MSPCKAESELLLLVEGVNDCHAISQIVWLARKAEPAFGIYECGSDNGVLDMVAATLVDTTRAKRVLGLVLDSDIEGVPPDKVVQSRLDQLRYRTDGYYSLPDTFPEQGLIVSPVRTRPDAHRLPKLGVWLMPNNRSWGMFEDLLIQSLPDRTIQYTTGVVDKAKVDGVAAFKDAHKAKAIVRTYMAWQDPDVQYLGLAVRQRMFPQVSTECRQFLQWLDDLFVPVI